MRGSAAFRTGVAPGGALAPGWVKNELWRRARAVPSLDLRFAENKSLVDATTGASLVTFTRASSGTFVGSDGVLRTAVTNEPRFDHNPTTGESLGLLVEEQRTNLLLNSATLSTQSVTVAAAANTLSFYGTGTVTLTGVSTAGPLVGTGANNRVSLTFTPTVGVLILTVSGSVTNAQLEAGAFPTSYIPTTTAAATRSADVASISGSNFSSWYNQTEGTVFAEMDRNTAISSSSTVVSINDNSSNNRLYNFRQDSASALTVISATGGTLDGALGVTLANTSNRNRVAAAQSLNNLAAAANGGTVLSDTSVAMPTVTQVQIGNVTGTSYFNGTIRRICFWPTRLPANTLQSITQ